MEISRLVGGFLSTNCYIVASNRARAFVIDPGDDAGKVRGFLKKKGLQAHFIVNTHGHLDHIRADKNLGLPVYIHEKDAAMLVHPETVSLPVFLGNVDAVEPSRLLKDGDTVALDELVFTVIHTPGHTPGSLCLWGGGVLFSGDTLFKDGIGRTDFPGASSAAMRRSLERLSRLDAKTRVYPGHGPETTIADEFLKS